MAVQPADACGELGGAGALAGAVALLTRGGCPFLHKARGLCAIGSSCCAPLLHHHGLLPACPGW